MRKKSILLGVVILLVMFSIFIITVYKTVKNHYPLDISIALSLSEQGLEDDNAIVCPDTTYSESPVNTCNVYVLCHSYWEQQTNAVLNLWSFQKWANKSGQLKVVEPFAGRSVLEFPESVVLNHRRLKNSLRFRDYFDLVRWTNETAKWGIAPLVTWDNFLKHASRKVIAVIPAFDAAPGGVYVDDEITDNLRCSMELDNFEFIAKSLLRFLHFEVIKTVCFAFYEMDNNISLKKFNSYLTSDKSVTIWFAYWRGIEPGRITMTDKRLWRLHEGAEQVLSMVHPSPRIINDSWSYVRTVLNVNFREYTAVLFRTTRRNYEMLVQGYSYGSIMDYFFDCVSKLRSTLHDLGGSVNFLATDIGKFGDQTEYRLEGDDSENLLLQFIQVVYGGNKSIDEYHKDFVSATNGIDDNGYVASVQKTIAENARCLIVMGGHSVFQQSVILNYQKASGLDCIRYVCYEDEIHPQYS